MSEYDDIRPYYDEEVPAVVARVVDNPEFGKAASKLVMPGLLQGTPLGEWITAQLLRLKTRHLKTVRECQLLVAEYFERLIDETIEKLTVSGLDRLDPARHYLFISNHRDIVMDSSLLNYLMHQAGHETCRMAVGDNLLTNELAADLMRLNKSFVVERNVTGAKATLNALSRTSAYIRHSLNEGVSIWIAQREGRAKDGWDRTDPAMLKMLALAYRENRSPIEDLVRGAVIVPVSISYELDPCAPNKAHELAVTSMQGSYDKSDEEDLQSIVLGMVGYKGRVHLHFGDPIEGAFEGPDALALTIDRAIMAGMHVFPTHMAAAAALGDDSTISSDDEAVARVTEAFNQQINDAPEGEREYLLLQYANILRNRRDLGI